MLSRWASLPKDTSFGARHYTAPDGFAIDLRVVLDGDVTAPACTSHSSASLGRGWRIDQIASQATTIRV